MALKNGHFEVKRVWFKLSTMKTTLKIFIQELMGFSISLTFNTFYFIGFDDHLRAIYCQFNGILR